MRALSPLFLMILGLGLGFVVFNDVTSQTDGDWLLTVIVYIEMA